MKLSVAQLMQKVKTIIKGLSHVTITEDTIFVYT
jgi:hypothetical protein